jgi:hypothetical protein
MSDDDEARHLTADEIGLLKEVARWRRNHDVTFSLHKGAGWWTRGWVSWDEPRNAAGIRRSVTFELDKEAGLGEVSDYHGQSFRWHEVNSVTQAVDVLVAYGYLPPRFSSAYRAGWDARADATDADGCLDLFTWPELAPAVDPTW